MADVNESDYGELSYGGGFYSYLPVWLVESNAPPIEFAASGSFGFARLFESIAYINFVAYGSFGFTYYVESTANIEIIADSNEYIGPPWISWVPEVPPGGIWAPGSSGTGIWIPVGPDMTPNEGP